MYYVIVQSSQYNKHTFSFEKKKDAIDFVVDQFEIRLKLFSEKKDEICNVFSKWTYASLLDYLQKHNFKERVTTDKIVINYSLKKDQKLVANREISWYMSHERGNSDVVNLMTAPEYEFECNISEEMLSGEVTLPGAAYIRSGAAYIRFNDIGVEFEFCIIENGENYSAIYRMDMNKAGDDFETDYDEFCHYEIDPTDPEWKANLEIAMCEALINLHRIGLHLKEKDIWKMFSKIFGMRFSSIEEMKEWIFKELNLKEYQLPDFAIGESSINDEIREGKANVDYVLNMTLGKDIVTPGYNDYSIMYLLDNNDQMIVTSVLCD